jgi:hypothetical protein
MKLTVRATAESGVKELVKAKDHQKSARKKMCCLVICFAIFMMIALSYVSFLVPGLRRRLYEGEGGEGGSWNEQGAERMELAGRR